MRIPLILLALFAILFSSVAYSEKTAGSVDEAEPSNVSKYEMANLIFSMVKSIRKGDYQKFYGLTCAYLSEVIPELDNLDNHKDIALEKKLAIKQQVALMKEYIDVGQIANNCNLPAG